MNEIFVYEGTNKFQLYIPQMIKPYVIHKNYIKMIKEFEVLRQKYETLKQQYKDSFEELYDQILQKERTREYSKGGEIMHRGYYSPSASDLIVHGVNRGRLINGEPKLKEYDYEYIFDKEDKLICCKQYGSFPDGIFTVQSIELLVYENNRVLSFVFDTKNSHNLTAITECWYENALLTRYEICHLDWEIRAETFEYSGRGLESLTTFDYHYSSLDRFCNKSKYFFERDSEGCVSMYTVVDCLNISQSENTYHTGLKPKSKKKNTVVFKQYLYDSCKKVIENWNEYGIYAISFFVYTNEGYAHRGIDNFPQFSISYNTESDCKGADIYSEERWNYAFWRQDETPIIEVETSSADMLMDWYKKNKITDIGLECDDEYDSDMNYIGKGPRGYYELLTLVSEVAKDLQNNGIVKSKFGNIPIIVHDLEYPWYVKEATENANPNGEAKDFLIAYDNLFE